MLLFHLGRENRHQASARLSVVIVILIAAIAVNRIHPLTYCSILPVGN
jgi:hypothetical protein